MKIMYKTNVYLKCHETKYSTKYSNEGNDNDDGKEPECEDADDDEKDDSKSDRAVFYRNEQNSTRIKSNAKKYCILDDVLVIKSIRNVFF
jgi:hypothetical protein